LVTGHSKLKIKFKLSKYGAIFALIYLDYFLFIYLVDPTETGPLGFLQYVSLIFYLPIFLLTFWIPIKITNLISFIIGVIIFYFIGVIIQKISKDKKPPTVI